MKNKRKKGKQILVLILSVAMVLGTMDISSLNALASEEIESEAIVENESVQEETTESEPAEETEEEAITENESVEEIEEEVATESELAEETEEEAIMENESVEETEKEVTLESESTKETEEETATESESVEEEFVYQKTTDEITTYEEWYELSSVETSALPVALFSLKDGVVELNSGTATAWIDRLNLSGTEEQVIREFYDVLVEATDNDGVNDYLIDDTYFGQDKHEIKVAEVKGTATNTNEISQAINDALGRYGSYIRAAYDAFDRDHPEVFWLTGSTVYGTSCSYSGTEQKGYTYTVTINFMVKGTLSNGKEFDMRDADFQSQSAIENAIVNRDKRTKELLSAAAGKTTMEKLQYFNQQLTTTNEYNTSADLNNIGHECRECTGALAGKTGTEGPVCEAYARAFKVLCDEAGIPCVLVDGYARTSTSACGEAHMWNYVQVGKNWYGADVTWNDPKVAGISGAISGYESEKWLLVGSDTEIGSLTFIESHPVANQVSVGGVAFTNGPALAKEKFVPGVQLVPTFTETPVISGTYGQKLSELKIKAATTSSNGAVGTWKLEVSEEELTEILEVNTQKEYTVVFVPEDKEAYTEYRTTVIPIISQKEITVKAEDKTRKYKEENPKLTFTYNAKDFVGKDTKEDLAITLKTVATLGSDVGDYAITGESTSQNYKVTITPGVLKITPAETNVIVADGKSNYKKTYGDTEFRLEGIQVDGEGTLVYQVTEGKNTEGKSKDTTEILSVSDEGIVTIHGSGSVVIVVDVKTDNNYKSSGAKKITIDVAKKEITVKAEDQAKVYGEENPKLTFTYDTAELVGKDTVADLAVTLKTEATKVSDVGTYKITGISASENYRVTVTPATLKVTQAQASITIAEGKEHYKKTFGDADFKLEGIQTIGKGEIKYTLSDGKDIEGQKKAEEDILSVLKDGTVVIQGSGSVTITISMEADKNYKMAEPKQITVQVARREGFNVGAFEQETYTGKAIKPEPAVYDGSLEKQLVKGKDYRISYKNNVNAYTYKKGERGFDAKKAPQIIITGIGNYSQKLTVYFTIQPKNLSDLEDESIIATDIVLEANGKVQKKVPVITYNKKKLTGVIKPTPPNKLKTKKDFIYSYPALEVEETKNIAFKEKGTYQILVEGTGNYTGNRIINLTITGKGTSISKATIKSIPSQPYNNGNDIELKEQDLKVTAKISGKTKTLKKDVDYTVSYENNKEIGTATVIITGKGEFAGTKKATFKITGASIAKANVTGLKNKVYNGKEQTQKLNLTLTTKKGSGKNAVTTTTTLVEGKHFEVAYTNNVKVGTAKVTIKGIGAYTGTLKKTFKITPYDFKGETDANGNSKKGSLLSEANGLLKMKDGELSVKYVKGGCKPDVQLFFNGTQLTAGKDYTISYSNNKAVTTEKFKKQKKIPMITIQGKGNFKGSFKKAFTIISRSLDDKELSVTMTAVDKVVNYNKAGGYISKPVLTDADGKVLKEGMDYTKPIYTTTDDMGNVVTLTNKSKGVGVGKVITVSVNGKGAYTGENFTTTYRITAKNFGGVKVQSIKKNYTGKEVSLSAKDFVFSEGVNKGKSKVTIGSGKNTKELVYGKDFEIVEGSYKNNLKKGTASVTLRGLGEYGGTKTIKFSIGAREMFW